MLSYRFLNQIPATDVERVVDALERRWRGATPEGRGSAAEGLAPAARQERPPDAPPAGGTRLRREDLYTEATRILGPRERALREDAAVVDALLGRLRSRLTPPPQTLLRLCGEAGDTTGGRFRLRNTSESVASFSFHPRGSLAFRFTPSHPVIPSGESVIVTVRVDLPGTSGCEELHEVDVYADGAPGLKLWIEIVVDAPVPSAEGQA